ncbi:hypothetical protein [Ectobacillus polymachus]|uniref:hypothetical protein n=1 Tax=Ectobacillus polymachus TaxID=1508806 RepID=UPI003A88F0CE
MKRKIGCLHAHHSNIAYIEQALSLYNIECIHFVDPGLMYHHNWNETSLQNKVKEQLAWIEGCDFDAIVITCTNYIAILGEASSLSVPIIKIDEPFFATICEVQKPLAMFFTNPETVSGTTKRLQEYASRMKTSLDVEIILIDGVFDLLMQGQIEEYKSSVAKSLNQFQASNKILSVAQLSMVDSANEVQKTNSITIINPLDSLATLLNKCIF